MLSHHHSPDNSVFSEIEQEVIDLGSPDLSFLESKLEVIDTSDILPREVETLADLSFAPSIVEEREETFQEIIEKIQEYENLKTQIGSGSPTDIVIGSLFKKHYDSEIKQIIKSFTKDEIKFLLQQKKDMLDPRLYLTLKQHIVAIEKRQKQLADWQKKRTKNSNKAKALRLHAKLQAKAKQHASKKIKEGRPTKGRSTATPLGHQDKKSPAPAPSQDDLAQKELKYEKSIRCRIERVQLVGQFYQLPRFLEADTLYLQLDYQRRLIFANAAGFKPEKGVIFELENSWQWIVFEFDKIAKHLMKALKRGSGDTISIPEIVDAIVELCGCIQGEKIPERWYDDSEVIFTPASATAPRPAKLDTIVKNCSQLLTNKIHAHNNVISSVTDSKKSLLHTALLTALNRIAYHSVGNFTINDFVVMYYYLEKYIEKTTRILDIADINLLIAVSFLYANKITEDNYASPEDLAEFFNVDVKKLNRFDREFSRVVQGDSQGKWKPVRFDQEAELLSDDSPVMRVKEGSHISRDDFQAVKAILEEAKPAATKPPVQSATLVSPQAPPPKKSRPLTSSPASSSVSKSGMFHGKSVLQGATQDMPTKGDENQERSKTKDARPEQGQGLRKNNQV